MNEKTRPIAPRNPSGQVGKTMTENPMRKVRLEKVTLNMGAGESGTVIEKMQNIMKEITGTTIVVTQTRKRNTFGLPKGRPIGAKTTVRGQKAFELVKRLLQAVDNRLKPGQFDSTGNFSFGVAEYINVPGIKYDPDIGIIGFDVCVTLTRAGYRVTKRRLRPAKIGKGHRITREEAMAFAQKELGAKISEEEE